MVTMKCTSCGETVLSTDKFCKQCGKPNEQKTEQKTETAVAEENPNKKKERREKDKKGKTINKWIVIVVCCISLVWLLGWVITYVGDIIEEQNVSSSRRVEQQSPIPQNKNEEIYQITGIDLYAAYNNNEAAADNKYKGKMLIVTGRIFEINKNYDGIYYIGLKNEGGEYDLTSYLASTYCYFPASRNSSLTSLQKGQFVSIKGRCIGKQLGSNIPQLNNCSLLIE